MQTEPQKNEHNFLQMCPGFNFLSTFGFGIYIFNEKV